MTKFEGVFIFQSSDSTLIKICVGQILKVWYEISRSCRSNFRVDLVPDRTEIRSVKELEGLGVEEGSLYSYRFLFAHILRVHVTDGDET